MGPIDRLDRMNRVASFYVGIAWFALAIGAFSSHAEARLLLYIDTSTSSDIEVIMIDNKTAGYEITSADTDDNNLIGKLVTVSDSDMAIGRISFIDSVESVNTLLGSGFEINSNFTAYSTSIDGPAPAGGEQLNVYANITKASGSSATIEIAATRTLNFAGQGWFYDHSASGTAVRSLGDETANEALIDTIDARGGISTTPKDFELTPGLFNGGAVDTSDAGEGLYAFIPGPVEYNSTVIGSLTMTLKFSATMETSDNIVYEGQIFATTPEPISIATWGLFGGGMWLTARRRRRRV
ncbi:MAG: hypothetical protein RLZZ396_1486 [Planctomycetota bacterium]